MPRGEHPLSGRRDMRLMSDSKGEFKESVRKLQRSFMADGFPPGTVPVARPNVQREQLLRMQERGARLSPTEQARLRTLDKRRGA